MFQALFLDLYDTLLTIDQDIWLAGKKRSAERLNVPLEPFLLAWAKFAHEEQTGQILTTEDRAKWALREMGLAEVGAPEIAQDDIEYQKKCTLVLPGVKTMLDQAKKRRFTVILVSNAGHSTENILEHHGLEHFFDHQVFSFDAGCRKPDPVIFQRALQVGGLSGEQVFYAGDGDSFELDAAKTHGMTTCRVEFPQKNKSFLDQKQQSKTADYVISSWDSLWDLPCW